MSSTTGFFGLQKLQERDPISTNDYAFTNKNIDIIDRLLGKLNTAVFENDTPLADPTLALDLDVITTGGLIPAGRTLRYKYTWVDPYGNESAASPEASVGTPSPITRPTAPGTQDYSSGGTLLAGNYFYIFSAWADVNTNETSGSQAGSITVRSGATNRIVLTLPSLPSGADGFNIFRRGPGESQFYYLDSVEVNVATPPTTYTDDNSISVTNSRTPSATNLTNSTNIIQITLPGATPSVPEGYTWKVYRTFINGDYSSSLLEWVVTESGGDIVITTNDSGLSTSIGMPPAESSLTGTVSKLTAVTDDVSAIQTILGTDPQGGYGDVAARLAGIEAAENTVKYFLFSDLATIYDDAFDGGTVAPMVVLNTDNNAAWIIEGQIFYQATSSEGLQFRINTATNQATPVPVELVKLQVDPDDLATPYSSAHVFGENDIVVLAGASHEQAVRVSGTVINTGPPMDWTLTLLFAQFNSSATPTGAIVKAGSWIKVTPSG